LIVLVEGPDGVGKSSFCDLLSRRMRWPVYKHEGDWLAGSMNTLETQSHDRGIVGLLSVLVWTDVILDRSFPTEMVYDRALGRKFDQLEVVDLDARMSRLPHMAVLLSFSDPTVGVVQAQERGMDELTPEQWKRVWEGYESYVRSSRMTWLKLDAGESLQENLFVFDDALSGGAYA
jgi:thymidylate kinase